MDFIVARETPPPPSTLYRNGCLHKSFAINVCVFKQISQRDEIFSLKTFVSFFTLNSVQDFSKKLFHFRYLFSIRSGLKFFVVLLLFGCVVFESFVEKRFIKKCRIHQTVSSYSFNLRGICLKVQNSDWITANDFPVKNEMLSRGHCDLANFSGWIKHQCYRRQKSRAQLF